MTEPRGFAELAQRVSDCFAGHCRVPDGARVTAACSGGADSVALVHLLAAHRERWPLAAVCFVDHGLRDDSMADATFVNKESAALGLACTVESIDVAVDARAAGETIEEAARRLRYQFLERVATSAGPRVVAVGHRSGGRRAGAQWSSRRAPYH